MGASQERPQRTVLTGQSFQFGCVTGNGYSVVHATGGVGPATGGPIGCSTEGKTAANIIIMTVSRTRTPAMAPGSQPGRMSGEGRKQNSKRLPRLRGSSSNDEPGPPASSNSSTFVYLLPRDMGAVGHATRIVGIYRSFARTIYSISFNPNAMRNTAENPHELENERRDFPR